MSLFAAVPLNMHASGSLVLPKSFLTDTFIRFFFKQTNKQTPSGNGDFVTLWSNLFLIVFRVTV